MTTHAAQAPIAVGVDVSKEELVIAELFSDGAFTHRSLKNTMAAAESYVGELAERGFTGRIIVESTGHHQWPIVLAGADTGLDVRLLNPLQAAARRQGRVRKTKNDRVDAEVLAEMAWTERKLPAPFVRSRAAIALRQQLQLLAQLERSIQRLQATLRAQREAAERAGVAPPESLAGLEASLEDFRAQRRTLQRESDALARQLADRQIAQAFTRLPGITADCAHMLASVLDPGAARHGWVAYIGLDVSVIQSGKFQGRGKLTKRGMPYLRKRLYQAAWGAAMNTAAGRRYYDALREGGRKHKEALVIIARKLLRAAHAVAQNPDQPIDEDRLFALPA
jgi:transposase